MFLEAEMLRKRKIIILILTSVLKKQGQRLLLLTD